LEEEKGLLKTVSLLQGSEEEIRITSLSRALARKVSFNWAVPFFIEGIEKTFGANFQEKILKEKEIEAIQKIRREKYGNDSWTFGL
jgi:lipoate-protein ligase A